MKWFNECNSISEVKAAYKKLAKQYHPDLGGDTLIMQQINKEYAFASAKAFRDADLSEEETQKEMNFSEQYREVIEQIIHLEGIVVELVGYWIWVTGETYPHRAELKAAGLRFACKKQAWYFCTDEFKARKWSKNTLEEIRVKYGSELIREDKRKRIAS
ncbi:hypothetical protein HDF26_002294 [Pedobacter cryoconitis]|uniref:J domain-containing protein n=1 Tax=Pedobacter cryoconitis TaxID=188932 RepID=UPI00160D9E14|nr:J domain-containing protein [Pedobacter cryoconitis]MBB6271837.1 hypothetical protein [Pedobacter cryoconitis]